MAGLTQDGTMAAMASSKERRDTLWYEVMVGVGLFIKFIFKIFLDYFNIIMLKINYFNIFLNKKL